MNNPPSLKILMRSLQQLCSQGSDIRGRFVDHPRLGRMAKAAHAISRAKPGVPALTPFAAFCLGHAFAQLVLQEQEKSNEETVTIAMGRDPRQHGICLCDAFGRGAQMASPNVRVVYTGIASTPSMYHFCR
jgi:phosphomannomutase